MQIIFFYTVLYVKGTYDVLLLLSFINPFFVILQLKEIIYIIYLTLLALILFKNFSNTKKVEQRYLV